MIKEAADCKDVVWDVETFPNAFTFAFCTTDKQEAGIFEISSRVNELDKLLAFIRHCVKMKRRMVGFNNKGFDYLILHYIIDKAKDAKKAGVQCNVTANEIYRYAQTIIEAMSKEDRFAAQISDKNEVVPQIDLYKIHHFDNKAKATGLKMLEFNMRSENIEDLPFPVGTYLTEKQIDVLKKYNCHDVLETLKFYHSSRDLITMREDLTKKFKINFMNANDTKIGKDYFIAMLEEKNPGCCYDMSGGRRKVRQTRRRSIDIGEIIFPYVKFERPEFQAVLAWFKSQKIKETKGVFSDILEKDLGEVAKYAQLVVKKKKLPSKPTEEEIAAFKAENPLCWVEEIQLKAKLPKKDGGGFKMAYWLNWNVAENLNVVVDGFRFDFGTGGIHGSIESRIVRMSDGKVIRDWDVASMYPNIAISNRVYPKHLGEDFCDIYEDVYNQRKSFAKGTPENAVMKLALNGVYGDSNNEFSPFYDPQYTMTITINGQLSLCMLAERLLKIEGLELIQVNTDGVTAMVPKEYTDLSDQITNQWEKEVKLELEMAEYAMMAIRDVNNYIAIYTNGKVKRKGAYEFEGLGWHQNQGGLVIPMAACEALVYGKSIEEFIYNHGDKFDFMLRTKVPRSSRLVLVKNDVEVPQQNICRYYISKDGGELVKIMPPLEGKEEERRMGIDVGWKVKTCNNVKSFEWDIDYDYYIQEAKKLVDPLFASDLAESA